MQCSSEFQKGFNLCSSLSGSTLFLRFNCVYGLQRTVLSLKLSHSSEAGSSDEGNLHVCETEADYHVEDTGSGVVCLTPGVNVTLKKRSYLQVDGQNQMKIQEILGKKLCVPYAEHLCWLTKCKGH